MTADRPPQPEIEAHARAVKPHVLSVDTSVHELAYATPNRTRWVNGFIRAALACSALAMFAFMWLLAGQSFGWLACLPFPLLASAGLVLGFVGAAKSARPRTCGQRVAEGAIILALFGPVVLIFSVALTGQGNSREPSPRLVCASNLKQIGLACLMYANEYGGRYPDTLSDVLRAEEITSDVFVCPSSAHTRATGPTTQAIAANLTAGGHLSYVYAGKGLTAQTANAGTVLAYEPLANHQGTGVNVLWADGHIDWVDAATARKITAEVESGHNPPRPAKLK